MNLNSIYSELLFQLATSIIMQDHDNHAQVHIGRLKHFLKRMMLYLKPNRSKNILQKKRPEDRAVQGRFHSNYLVIFIFFVIRPSAVCNCTK